MGFLDSPSMVLWGLGPASWVVGKMCVFASYGRRLKGVPVPARSSGRPPSNRFFRAQPRALQMITFSGRAYTIELQYDIYETRQMRGPCYYSRSYAEHPNSLNAKEVKEPNRPKLNTDILVKPKFSLKTQLQEIDELRTASASGNLTAVKAIFAQ